MNELYSEITVRNTKIKNRIVMPAMVCPGLTGEDGLLSIKNTERYRDRARGGVGLIVIEATCVDKAGRLSLNQLGLWSDDQVRPLSRLAGYCHEHDARVLVQLHHGGLAAALEATGEHIAPSNFEGLSRSKRSIRARALTLSEIASIQEKYVSAAIRARRAGLDGIELHASDGHLISQFFSPLVNKREDDYGGSTANRTRFATEIVSEIRKAAGADFVISCRMGCDEPDLESSIQLASVLEKAGVDILNISTGANHFLAEKSPEPAVPKYFHYNWVVYWGTLIKEKVGIPVIVGYGIRDPLEAGNLVENKQADFIAIGRGLLVDPEWANKGQKYLQVINCLHCKDCAYRNPPRSCPLAKRKVHYY